MIEHSDLSLCALDRHARFQARKHGEIAVRYRDPKIGSRAYARSDVAARCNADDGLQGIVIENSFTKDRWIAMELPVPIRPAHDYDIATAVCGHIVRTD